MVVVVSNHGDAVFRRRPSASTTKPTTYVTPRLSCSCGGSLTNHHEISGRCVSFEGLVPVIHVTKRCVRKACRRTHCYNYRWQSGSKYNNVDLCEIDVLFVTSKLAFEKRFLQYHCSLQFRGFVSARAIAWACRDSLLGSGLPRHWHVNYEDARFLFTAMSELEDMRNSGGEDFTRNIQLTNNGGGRGYGMEMTDTMLSAYSAYLHDNIFPVFLFSRFPVFLFSCSPVIPFSHCLWGAAPPTPRGSSTSILQGVGVTPPTPRGCSTPYSKVVQHPLLQWGCSTPYSKGGASSPISRGAAPPIPRVDNTPYSKRGAAPYSKGGGSAPYSKGGGNTPYSKRGGSTPYSKGCSTPHSKGSSTP